MAGLIALSLLVLCGLLPMLGEMASTMRAGNVARIREAQNAKLAAAILAFDDVSAYAREIHGRMYADGLLPDRRKAVRS